MSDPKPKPPKPDPEPSFPAGDPGIEFERRVTAHMDELARMLDMLKQEGPEAMVRMALPEFIQQCARVALLMNRWWLLAVFAAGAALGGGMVAVDRWLVRGPGFADLPCADQPDGSRVCYKVVVPAPERVPEPVPRRGHQ